MSDCFKAAFARSFPLSISGLFRSISALLSHLFRHIACYAPQKMEQNPRKYPLNILRNKFQTASSFLKQIPRRTPCGGGSLFLTKKAGYMTESPPNMYPAKLPRPRWGLLHQGASGMPAKFARYPAKPPRPRWGLLHQGASGTPAKFAWYPAQLPRPR